MGFVINNEIKDTFDDIRNIASILSRSSVFEQGVSIEELVDWEKNNAISMPDMYKSWLSLTSYSRIIEGEFEIFMPKNSDEDSNGILIGIIGGGLRHLYFSKKDCSVYTIGDERIEYEDFNDFLSYVYIMLENEAQDEYGDEWENIYDEKYGDD